MPSTCKRFATLYIPPLPLIPRLNPYLSILSQLAFRFGAHLLTRQPRRCSIIPRPRPSQSPSPSPRSQPSGIPASAFVVNNFFSLLGAWLLQLECVLSAQRYKRYISREQPTAKGCLYTDKKKFPNIMEKEKKKIYIIL